MPACLQGGNACPQQTSSMGVGSAGPYISSSGSNGGGTTTTASAPPSYTHAGPMYR